MNTKLFKILPLAVLGLGPLALPVAARDHDGHWGRGGHGRYYGGHRHYSHSPHFSFGFYSSPYYYDRYYGPSVVYTRPVYVDRGGGSVEVDVQRTLAKKGYYGGVLDGDIGPQTRAAIRAYQVDKGLPVSGRIDGNLLRSLNLL